MLLKSLVGLLVVGLVSAYPMQGCGGDCGDSYGSWWDWGSWYGGGGCNTGGCDPGVGCGGCDGGYGGCDLGMGCGGQGVMPFQGVVDPGLIMPQPLPVPVPVDECPAIEKCTDIENVKFAACNSTDECLRSEACCQNPCSGRKECLIAKKTSQYKEANPYLLCPGVQSCAKLLENHDRKECDDDDDCKRNQKCCEHPCDDSDVGGIPSKICFNATTIPVNPVFPYNFK